MMMDSPQFPYGSCLLSASAGSGKTFQLCRRFLHLVAAGSEPHTILTVTFTVKAAREMRSRILAEATNLLRDRTFQGEFDTAAQHFYRHGREFWLEQGMELSPPLSAIAVGSKILASSQQLRITTMDALFREWTSEFPHAAGLLRDEAASASELGLSEPWEEAYFHEQAWRNLFKREPLRREVLALWQVIVQQEPELGVLGLERRIRETYRHHTRLWQLQQLGVSGFVPHRLLLADRPHLSFEAAIKELAPCFAVIIRDTTKEAVYQEALVAGDLRRLQKEGLLTQQLEISKAIIKGKKREQRLAEIHEVESLLARLHDHQQLVQLNTIGEASYRLYELWLKERQRLKHEQGKIEFSDLAMGSYRLFADTQGEGANFEIQRRLSHLLIDEMQDTSSLQWGIFSCLMEELLAGSGAAANGCQVPTAFVVGDKKQSIYGFREAEPAILSRAGELLASQGWPTLELSTSYRSAQCVLTFVNSLFCRFFDQDFPLHSTARGSDGSYVFPDVGNILVYDACETNQSENEHSDDSSSDAAAHKEAEFIACFLAEQFASSNPYQVYDKARTTFRPLGPADCCLLYRSSTHVALLEEQLQRYSVPYRREEQGQFYARREIADMLAFMRFLHKPSDCISLLTVLRSPICALLDEEIVRYAAATTECKEERCVAILSLLANEHPHLAEMLASLQTASWELLPYELLTRIYQDFSALQAYLNACPGTEGEIAEKNLLQLLEIVISCEEKGHRDLAGVLAELEHLVEQDEQGSAAGAAAVVTLMTIHKAKGLEFPLVGIMGLGDDWFQSDPYWLKDEAGLVYVGVKAQHPRSSDNPLSLALERQREMLRAEAVRLLYVALTRAQQYLVLVGSSKKRGGPRGFFPLIQDVHAALYG